MGTKFIIRLYFMNLIACSIVLSVTLAYTITNKVLSSLNYVLFIACSACVTGLESDLCVKCDAVSLHST